MMVSGVLAIQLPLNVSCLQSRTCLITNGLWQPTAASELEVQQLTSWIKLEESSNLREPEGVISGLVLLWTFKCVLHLGQYLEIGDMCKTGARMRGDKSLGAPATKA